MRVICFTADLGQEEELDGLEEKALKTGASKLYIRDLREEFLTDFVFPTVQAGAFTSAFTCWARRSPAR